MPGCPLVSDSDIRVSSPPAQPPEQLFFADFPRPTPPLPFTLSLAVFPPPSAGFESIAHELRARHRLGGTPLAPDRLHISLHAFDHRIASPREIVLRAREAASSLTLAPFNVTFDRALSFPRQKLAHPLVLCGDPAASALHHFHDRLRLALINAGLGRHTSASSAFLPHVTLLYDRKSISGHPIDPITWTVDNFSLVLSPVGKTRCVPLGTWSLK